MKRLLLQIFAWLAILVGVGLMLQPTAAEIVTQVALTDSAGAVLAQAEESIAGSNTDTGVYYRFRVSVTEGE